MPASEIDDIFASKGKGKSLAAASSSSSALLLEKKKKKKKEGKEKSAKRKREDNAGEDAAPKPPKRQVPETVFDPSSSLSSSKKSQAGKADKPATNAAKPMRPKMDREEEARFKDSRGTGPRTFLSLLCAAHVYLTLAAFRT